MEDKVDETAAAEFVGRPYNFSEWRSTLEEREYFRSTVARAGDPAPDFTLPALDGTEVTLSSFRGTPVMIEFGSIT